MLEIVGVIIHDGKDPIEWIDEASQNLKQLIQILPIFANDDDMLFCQHIMKDLYKFQQVEFMDKTLDIVELVRNVVAFAVVDKP